MVFSQHHIIRYLHVILIACIVTGLSGCRKNSPQPVRHLGEETTVDSTLLAKMEFNQRMASAADRECLAWIKNDSNAYTLDDFGFWYKKENITNGETIQSGQTVQLHVMVHELNGNLLADLEDAFVLGSDNMPIAMNRALKAMRIGEEMTIVTPWYLAYGAEGKGIIKPYTNLVITLEIEE